MHRGVSHDMDRGGVAHRITAWSRAPRRIALIGGVALALLLGSRSAGFPAGMPVFDASVFGQAILQVARGLQLVQLTIRDLAPLTQLRDAAQLVVQLNALMAQVDTISQRMIGRRGMWRSTPDITSLVGLANFRSSATQLCQTVTTDALDAQGIIEEAARLLGIVSTMVDTAQHLVGSVAGLQNTSFQLGTIAGQMTALQLMSASNNESTLCDSWHTHHRKVGVMRLQQRWLQRYGQFGER
jgi:hypothetical protein